MSTVLILWNLVSISPSFSLSIAFTILQTSVTSPLILLAPLNSHSHFSLSSKGICLCCGPQCPLFCYFHWEKQTGEKMPLGQWNSVSHIKRGLHSLTVERESAGNSQETGNLNFFFSCTDFFKYLDKGKGKQLATQPTSCHGGHLEELGDPASCFGRLCSTGPGIKVSWRAVPLNTM